MTHHVDINWLDGVAFNAHADDHSLIIDAPFEAGGENKGIRPKMLLLASLGGCTGVDVVLILKKMKVNLKDLRISVEGHLTENHPRIYETINIKYIFRGYDLDRDKLKKAIDLSQEKYCGVTAMLKNTVKIDYEIVIEELKEAKSH